MLEKAPQRTVDTFPRENWATTLLQGMQNYHLSSSMYLRTSDEAFATDEIGP
jgi:hypothetical protein